MLQIVRDVVVVILASVRLIGRGVIQRDSEKKSRRNERRDEVITWSLNWARKRKSVMFSDENDLGDYDLLREQTASITRAKIRKTHL